MEILIFFLSISSISLLIAYTHVSYNLKKTTAMLAETMLLYLAATDNQVQINDGSVSPENIHQENFIKFLSDSRDWAYEYIENVQNGLKEFITEVEPSIKFFNQYGIISEGSPHYKDMKTISDNFEKLKNLLPEEIDDRR